MKVGIIGLGSMGMGSALNLVAKGHDVTGCELREAAWPELQSAGGACVASPDALPDNLDALIVFVVNAAQAEAVLFSPPGGGGGGAVPRLAPGGVVLCCTTLSPDVAKSLAARIEAAGLHFLDAPFQAAPSAPAAAA